MDELLDTMLDVFSVKFQRSHQGRRRKWLGNVKLPRDGKSRTLIGLQSYFLREHHIASDQITDRKKASADKRAAFLVELFDICRDTLPNTVSDTGFTADHLEIPA